YRGNWMEPLSITNKRAGIKDTPRFVVHQFGGDTGGPIVSNRTFFFGLAEWNKRREAPDPRNDINPATIPTPTGYAALQNLPLRPATTTQVGVIPAQSVASRQATLSALSFLQDMYPQIANFDRRSTVSVNGVPVEVGIARIAVANPKDFFYNVAR